MWHVRQQSNTQQRLLFLNGCFHYVNDDETKVIHINGYARLHRHLLHKLSPVSVNNPVRTRIGLPGIMPDWRKPVNYSVLPWRCAWQQMPGDVHHEDVWLTVRLCDGLIEAKRIRRRLSRFLDSCLREEEENLWIFTNLTLKSCIIHAMKHAQHSQPHFVFVIGYLQSMQKLFLYYQDFIFVICCTLHI